MEIAVKYLFAFMTIVPMIAHSQGSSGRSGYPIDAVPLRDVVISDDFWLPKIALVQDTTIHYAFTKCAEEGRFDNFLVAGGKEHGTFRGKMPFDDTDPYKIIEGASYSLISKPNPALDSYLDSIIAIIRTGQEADGYLTTWFTIDRKHPPAWWVKPSTERWEHLESSHELYNSGHLFEAAAAHYWATGKRTLLDVALKNADLLCKNFGPGPGRLHKPPGHQIVETGLIKLYAITHDEKYLSLAKYFLDVRGDSTTHTLQGPYSQDHEPVVHQTEAVGHAVRALYMYAGMADIAALYQNKEYLQAVRSIWNNIIDHKMYITGGLGSRRDGEAFGENDELPNLTAYNETCASIGSVMWNQRMFRLSGDAKYYDVIERTLYNGLLSGISLDGKRFFYPNPTESDGIYEFNMGAATRQPWFDCSCCPTNLIRFIPSLPGLIYAVTDDTLFVNLFIAGHARASVNGMDLEIVQRTKYPWDGHVTVVVRPDVKRQFTVKIRVPDWCRGLATPGSLYSYTAGNQNEYTISVNGRTEITPMDRGYALITREWNTGDSIVVNIPMAVRTVVADPRVKSDSGKVAFEYGPFVYCAEQADNDGLSSLVVPASAEFRPIRKSVLSEHVAALEGNIDGKTVTLVPYYVWSNRGAGGMKIWFPRRK